MENEQVEKNIKKDIAKLKQDIQLKRKRFINIINR